MLDVTVQILYLWLNNEKWYRLEKKLCTLELDCKEIRKFANEVTEILQNIMKVYTGESFEGCEVKLRHGDTETLRKLDESWTFQNDKLEL